jgi:pimeloyl-ACP methyl ester carboxylesterase
LGSAAIDIVADVDFDVTLPSGRVRVRRRGEPNAPLLLCVHGLSANLTAYDYLAEQLAGDHRQVVAFDLRGCGRSAVTAPGSYGLDHRCDDVLDLADALGAKEFDLAGWSLGALIAMRTALRAGRRLRSVTLIDHAGPANRAALGPVQDGLDRLDAVVAQPADYLALVRTLSPIAPWSGFWDTFYGYELQQRADGQWAPTTSRAAAEEDLHQPWPRDWREHWRALTMPTMLIRATGTGYGVPLIADQTVAALTAENPGVRVIETPDSGHDTCMHDPLTAAAITEVLAASARP